MTLTDKHGLNVESIVTKQLSEFGESVEDMICQGKERPVTKVEEVRLLYWWTLKVRRT